MDFTLKGADCRLYLNNKAYNVAQQVQWSIDYGEEPIYGIDSMVPQEIASTKLSVSGSVVGLVLRMDGGLQGGGLRPKILEAIASPYISLRIEDRVNKADLLWVDRIKISRESVTLGAKGTIHVSFSFVGILPYQTLDLD